jgi:hypothetical protein
MPSFAKGIEKTTARDVVKKAVDANSETDANDEQRTKLLAKYMK